MSFGNGSIIGSVNYDRLFWMRPKFRMSAHVGILPPFTPAFNRGIGLTGGISALTGQRIGHFEPGVYYTQTFLPASEGKDYGFGGLYLGYRKQNVEGGFFFRAGASLNYGSFAGQDGVLLPMLGLGFGVTAPNRYVALPEEQARQQPEKQLEAKKKKVMLRATASLGISGVREIPMEPSGQAGSVAYGLRGLGTGLAYTFGLGYEVNLSKYMSFVNEFEIQRRNWDYAYNYSFTNYLDPALSYTSYGDYRVSTTQLYMPFSLYFRLSERPQLRLFSGFSFGGVLTGRFSGVKGGSNTFDVSGSGDLQAFEDFGEGVSRDVRMGFHGGAALRFPTGRTFLDVEFRSGTTLGGIMLSGPARQWFMQLGLVYSLPFGKAAE
ncbi:MAG: hypothetical protein AAF570_19815 [Bacteroidota bacterium]